MLLQKMPEQHEDDPDAWQRAVHFASTLTRKELLGLPARQIIHRLYHEEDIRVFDPQAVNFHCPCSRERVAGMLRMLGHEEVQAMLQEQDTIEVDCEFCNKHYVFDKVDAEQAFASEVPTRHRRICIDVPYPGRRQGPHRQMAVGGALFQDALAGSQAVDGGKVHCNGERIKPARAVRVGDELHIRQGPMKSW